MSESFVLFADTRLSDAVGSLTLAGFTWTTITSLADLAAAEVTTDWTGAVIMVGEQPDVGWAIARELRSRDVPVEPLLIVLGPHQLPELVTKDQYFDDFLLTPVQPDELQARLRHLVWRAGRGHRPELIEYGPLVLNVETYQASLEGEPLDLTYMEYELLRFLTAQPGKVFTRETLLNRVWGYEYYGGARTVDVHVRRLRAKLGQEHAPLIQTVRSVGYKLGRAR